MAMTREERASRKAERKASAERLAASHAEALAIVKKGSCPQCGHPLRYNGSMLGWWQCAQYGAERFRLHADKPSCSFQCFTS